MKNKHVIDLEDISREELMEIIELANKIMANPEVTIRRIPLCQRAKV